MVEENVIWGSSGHAKVLAAIILSKGHHITAFFDNDIKAKSVIDGTPLFIGYNGFDKWLNDYQGDVSRVSALVAIGGSRGRDRFEIQEFMRAAGLKTPITKHPASFVSPSSSLGKGSQVLAGSVISVLSTIGEACIINTNASVDHECLIGDGVHIAPGATLCGCVTVERFSMIGAGAVVLPRTKIGEGSVIGAGSVVTKDIPSNVVAFGSPARVIREILPEESMLP